MMLAQTLPPLPLQPTTLGKRSCSMHHHDQETIAKKKLKTASITSTGCGSDAVDRVAMLQLRFADIISKSEIYLHGHEDEEATARRKKILIETQRKAARLELENVEENAILQVENNFQAIKQLEDLAGCSFGFVIDPKVSEDGGDDDSKVTVRAIKGKRSWNPLQKIGLTIKDDQGELQVKKTQEKPRHHSTRTGRLQSLESQRLAARLELHRIESNADIQDNLKSFKQLQGLAGCCLGFRIDPSLDDDDAAKVTMGAFRGNRFWNPMEKIGLHLKN